MPEEKTVPFFVLAKPETFKWPVKVPVPAEGRYVFATFTGVFKHLDEAEFKKLYSPEAAKTDRQIAEAVLIGVEDLTGEDGQAVPSSDALRLQVLGIQRAAPAIAGTYRAAMLGVAAEKN
jgi:hypothetical protein